MSAMPVRTAIAMDAPALLSLTKLAPLTAAAAMASRPVTDAAMANRYRARMARVNTFTAATSKSRPSPACTASTTGRLVSARPSADAIVFPRVGGRDMDVKADAEPVLGDEHQRDAQAVAPQAGDPARLPGRVGMRRGHAAADRLGVVRSHCELPPCPGEQITDRRAEDAGCIALVDLAGPDAVRAGVAESDAR